MVASICLIQRLSGLLSSCLRFLESKGQTIHLTGGVLTSNVAVQLPVPPAMNFGGAETTSLLHPLNSPMLRGDSEEIDFVGLHLYTKTHIPSQWHCFIDIKTNYNHFRFRLR